MTQRKTLWIALCGLSLVAFACSPATVGQRIPPPDLEAAEGLDLPTTPTGALPGPAPPPAADPAAELAAELTPNGEDLEGVDRRPSPREALERAIAWATEGVRLYRDGDHEGARRNLNDARIALLDADLPEAIQEQGLSVLGCALSGEFDGSDLEAIAEILELEPHPDLDDTQMAEHEYIERQVRRILRRFGAPTPREEYLRTFVDEVQRYVDYYRDRGREFFERAYQRKHKYWPTIEGIFEARSIPIELGYMALVESGFNPRARSRAYARGLWQFIPATGKRYGLRHTDDFYDVRKATEAAAEYLLDLIGIFGSHSFLLATAAYNAGEQRIENCLRDLEDPFEKRSFWEIRDCLARETREYVPRIMAAAVIGTDPRRFGFELRTEAETRERYDVVTIPAITHLSSVARDAGTTVAELRTANTDLSPTATTTPARNYPIYVPRGGGERLAGSLAASPSQAGASWPAASPSSPSPPAPSTGASEASAPPSTGSVGSPPPGASVEYLAQGGDTLDGIARSFGVQVADLEEWNPFLKRRVLYRGDRLTVYPGTGGAERRLYRVRRGDTLSEIAERHGVGYREVASWNDLRPPYRLAVGQELVLYPRGRVPERLVYTVKRGNTLRTIADIFSVRYRDIMAWNNLRGSTLRIGQKLIIHPPRPVRVETYRVARGDTVAKIARRFGVPVREVLTANGLRSRTLIRPGDRLVVYVGA